MLEDSVIKKVTDEYSDSLQDALSAQGLVKHSALFQFGLIIAIAKPQIEAGFRTGTRGMTTARRLAFAALRDRRQYRASGRLTHRVEDVA